MAGQTPDQLAQRWAQNLGSAGQRIADGVASVTVAPGQAAARQKTVWAQNVVAAQDKWARNVGAVTLAEWQQAMTEKGVQRIASGATAAQGKFGNFMTQLLPHIDQVKRSLPARGNLDQNITRAVTFMRGMAGFSYKR